jgi:hypothetical protein
MRAQNHLKLLIVLLVANGISMGTTVQAQVNSSNTKIKKASKKIEAGFQKENQDTLAQGYFDLGESFYQKGEYVNSEAYYKKSKEVYENIKNAAGIAKSSRALANVQEALHKNYDALKNYTTAQKNNFKTGDSSSNALNTNDILRLSMSDTSRLQQISLQSNIDIGRKNKDTGEIIANYSRMADFNLRKNETKAAVESYKNAYLFSKNDPQQALWYNQKLTDAYLKEKDFDKAVEAKQELLSQPFVNNSTQFKASEITSLADIYIQKKEADTAIRLLNQSYQLSIKNGHTLEAKKCIEKLDSVYQNSGKKELSLALYKNFLQLLPGIIEKDSSLVDNKIFVQTEERINQLEKDKIFKDGLIRKKNIFTYWLIGSIALLVFLVIVILYMLNKLRIKNKKIALQSLRREMNPHFIFNSLNSINQFIASNNELEANQYLTRFSTLMRRVMENSKEDFVLFSKETELLQNYLELEKSRFPEKFDFSILIHEELQHDEQLYIPGMLIQPHLENAIWHGLRQIEKKGFLQLNITKNGNAVKITIEDNGIGIAASKQNKTAHQKQHSGRGIKNTLERIKILNELYHKNITCKVEDKPAPQTGVLVTITAPLLKDRVGRLP